MRRQEWLQLLMVTTYQAACQYVNDTLLVCSFHLCLYEIIKVSEQMLIYLQFFKYFFAKQRVATYQNSKEKTTKTQRNNSSFKNIKKALQILHGRPRNYFLVIKK